jgi:transcription antitermination factor NusA-like protein
LKYPLDKICVKSGILCPNCQRKVDTGLVGKYEIPIMRAMIELEEEMKELRRGEYIKSYELDGLVIIIIRDHWEREEIDRISKGLSAKLRKRVKVVVDKGNKKELVEQILFPATLLGMNTLWLPDGSEQIIVRVSRRDQRFIGGRKDKFEKLLGTLLNRNVMIRFE